MTPSQRVFVTPFFTLAAMIVLLAVTPHDGHAINSRTQLAPTGEMSGDSFGWSVSNAGDFNGDGFDDVIVGATGNGAGGALAGRAYLYFGGPAADTLADLEFTGSNGDRLGTAVSGAGDVNGDGYDDVIVSAPWNDTGGNDAGQVYVFLGGPGADNVADWTLTGEAPDDRFGLSVSGAGDVNGDGYDDVIVGTPFHSSINPDGGRAYVFFGGSSPDATPDVTMDGEGFGDELGVSVAGAGDVNGDGYADVIAGAHLNGAGGLASGRAYVFYGGPEADGGADLTFTGAADDRLGMAVSDAGDMNGDGYGDVIVGARTGGTGPGSAYIFYGGPMADEVVDLQPMGEATPDFFGHSVSAAGDVNGDGFDDVIVGAFDNSAGGNSAGRAYIYFGGPGADITPDIIFTGEELTRFGTSVGGGGDLNGDEFDDVVVGARLGAPNGRGQAYVYDQFRYILQSPNGGEAWPVGSTQTISWLGRDLADVWLSTDGGLTYDQVESSVGGSATNDLMFLVPHAPSKFSRIKLTPSDPGLNGRDHSDSLFTIETSVSLLTFAVAARPGGGAELSWSTEPAVGPQGIAGYQLYRRDAGEFAADPGARINPSLITTNHYVDAGGSQGATYRLTAVNHLGQEFELGREMLAPALPLAAWPMPYVGGVLNVSFASASGLGGGAGGVEVDLFDAAGRHVRSLASGTFAPGFHTTTWDGRDDSGQRAASGIYFLRLVTEGQTRQMKVVVAE